MRYYSDFELSQLELLPSFWIVEMAICDFDGDTLRLMDEGA